jgi:hypothetical protein
MTWEGVAYEPPPPGIQVVVAPLELHPGLIAMARLWVEQGEPFRQQRQALPLRIDVRGGAEGPEVGRRYGWCYSAFFGQLGPMARAYMPWRLGLVR